MSDTVTKRDYLLYTLLFLTVLVYLPGDLGPGFFDGGVILSFLCFVLVRDVKWSRYWKNPLLLTWFVYCGWVLFTGIVQTPLPRVLYVLRKWPMRSACMLIIFVEMAHSEKETDRNVSIYLFVFFFLWMVFGSLLTYVIETGWRENKKLVLFGTHWNIMARHMNLLIPAVLTGFFRARHRFKTVSLLVLSLLSILIVVMTQSRGGIGSLAVGVFLLLYIIDVLNINRKRLLLLCLIGLVSLGVFFSLGAFDGLSERLQRKDYINTSGRLGHIWPIAIEKITANPYLGSKLVPFQHGNHVHGDAHNLLLEVAVNGGFLAVLLYLLFWYLLGRNLLRGALVGSEKNYYLLALFCSFVTIFVVHGIVEAPSYVLHAFFLGLVFIVKENRSILQNLLE